MHLEDLLYLSKSPPQVRSSIKRIRNQCSQRWQVARELLWPIPWHFRPPYSPLSVAELETNGPPDTLPNMMDPAVPRPRYTALRAIPALRSHMLGPLDRDELRVRVRLLRRGAALETTAHPAAPRHDTDPQRLAVLATLVEAFVEAFNWRLDPSLRRDRSRDTTSAFERERAPVGC